MARGKAWRPACTDLLRGDRLIAMHASAALGTAIYERRGERWRVVRGFQFTCRGEGLSGRTIFCSNCAHDELHRLQQDLRHGPQRPLYLGRPQASQGCVSTREGSLPLTRRGRPEQPGGPWRRRGARPPDRCRRACALTRARPAGRPTRAPKARRPTFPRTAAIAASRSRGRARHPRDAVHGGLAGSGHVGRRAADQRVPRHLRRHPRCGAPSRRPLRSSRSIREDGRAFRMHDLQGAAPRSSWRSRRLADMTGARRFPTATTCVIHLSRVRVSPYLAAVAQG